MKPENIIIPVICAAICIGLGIWQGVEGNIPYLIIWLLAAVLSFVPLIKAVISARKEKKDRSRKEDNK